MSEKRHTQQAAAEAGRARQLLAAGLPHDQDPKVAAGQQFQRRLDRTSHIAPMARTACWLLSEHVIEPVPLDGKLSPVGGPVDNVDAVLSHWGANPDHNVGITTGKHPMRDWTYLAVAVDRFADWEAFTAKVCTVTETIPNYGGFADWGNPTESGPPIKKTRSLNPGPFARLSWSPPPFPRMSMWRLDAHGGPLANEMRSRAAGRGGWIWITAPGDIHVRRDRKVASGVRLLSTGTVIPWEGSHDRDGWTLQLQSPMYTRTGLAPGRDPIRPFMLDALTG